MAKIELKQRMKGFLMFLPNLVGLSGRLLTDSRVPMAEKALFAGAIVYAIVPFDFIPDMIPFVGQVDDIYLIALVVLRLLNHTDEEVVRDNWRGGGDIVALASSVASLAPLILPQRVRRVLSSKVEMKKDLRGAIESVQHASPLLVEIPVEEDAQPQKVTTIRSKKRERRA
jgi:uncharacterized membrane protein YkvA (DUF1232 family)